MPKVALVVGDSHVDHSNLAKHLKKELEGLGYEVKVAGAVGTTAASWLSNDKVCRTNDKSVCVDKPSLPKNPDLLIISLGTNDIAASASSGGDQDAKADKIVDQVTQLAQYFSPAKVLWVGPPWFRDNWKWAKNAYAQPLYQAAARANAPIFDSREATRAAVEAGSGDGVHLGDKGAKAWATAIAATLGAKPETVNAEGLSDKVAQAETSPLLIVAIVLGALLLLRRKA